MSNGETVYTITVSATELAQIDGVERTLWAMRELHGGKFEEQSSFMTSLRQRALKAQGTWVTTKPHQEAA